MAEHEHSISEAEEQIAIAEQREAEARVKPDFLALEELWSDLLFINGTEDLIFTKQHIRARLETGTLRYRTFERRPTKIAVHGPFAIASGNESIVPLTGPDAGNILLCSYMNVWALEAGRWRLVGRHVNMISKTPAEYF